jgi:TonB family protein
VLNPRYTIACLLAALVCMSGCASPERADISVSDREPDTENTEPSESTDAGSAAEMTGTFDTGPRVISIVAYRKIDVIGGLDTPTVRRLLRRHRREVSFCHKRQLERDSDLEGDSGLEGDVDVRFRIDATGDVEAAMIERSTLGDESVEHCLTKRIPRWVFPEPIDGGPVEVLFPITFAIQID